MERGILFDKRQVLAVLNNGMTQTRQVMRIQPPENAFNANLCTPIRGDYMPSHWKNKFGYMWGEPSFKKADLQLNELKFVASPYGKVGDLLYVRETWAEVCHNEHTWCEGGDDCPYCRTEYKADTGDAYPGQWPADEAKGNPDAPKWRASIHMKKKYARIRLQVTNVRVEKLQDITPDNILAEGFDASLFYEQDPIDGNVTSIDPIMAIETYQDFWDKVNAKSGYLFDSNPWIWITEFEKV